MQEIDFDSLFRQEYPRLYRLAYAWLGDAEESRDVVSGVFSDLLERKQELRSLTPALLTSVVRHKAVDMLRHQQVVDESRAVLLMEYKMTLAPDPISAETLREIRHYIETELPPQTQRILQMCYDEKMSYKQVAEVLDVSTQTVNKHISLALQKLRLRFNPHHKTLVTK